MSAPGLLFRWGILVPAFLLSATLSAAPFTWTVGADVAAPQFNNEDADAGVVQDGANLWVQTSLWPNWRRFLGSDFDHLVAQPDAQRDASFNQPNGDDAYWTDGMWEDSTGKFYAIIHIEYHYAVPRTAFLWQRRVGLATSKDQGANWHYEGDILTTNPARPGSPGTGFFDFGCGDTYLFVDRRQGFFYVFYMTAWVESSTGWRTAQAMSVARCPISANMAPGSWVKWNGSTWTAPGLGGVEATVFSGADSAVVHFNSYLNAYVALGRDTNGSSWIANCSTLDGEDWQPRDYTFPQRLYWYNWPVDPVTHDRYEIGQNFRVYSSQANVNGVGSKYMDVALLSSNGNTAPAVKLTNLAEGSVSYSPAQITFTVAATDGDGSIKKVEFFANNIKVGESTGPAYSFTWQGAAPGSYRLSARATDDTGAATNSAGVDVIVKAYTFEQWKLDHGISVNTPDDAVAPDGIPNLLKYALNLDASGSEYPVPKIDGANLVLSYNKLRSDVTYIPECSTDLVNWTSAGVAQTGTSSLVTASTPLSSAGKLFLHVRVTHP